MITKFYPIAKIMMDDYGVAGKLDRMMEKNAMSGRKAGARQG
jgi:predicted PilT family ATPase